jgi:protein-S-isoprenylcysteine O-methyltransferase Ste14
MEGVLEEFLQKLNRHNEPIKESIQNVDSFSMLFLFIGFLATTVLATIFGYFVKLEIAIGLACLYLVLLAFVFFWNHREL